ncbi:MAG: hypothetical protein WD623_15480 [Marinobacter sp.]|uniref:hypothetical protein n=1 Tax=Marinobacter sp. TaxID=50741 RepID=UPI0034A04973
MMVSEEVQYSHCGGPLICRDDDDMDKGCVDESLKETIPHKYRDGRGGINIEQVRRDQRQAQRQFIRSMIRHLKQLRRQR